MTEIIAGREVLSNGALGPETCFHISSVQKVSTAPTREDACIVRRFGDKQEYMVDESEKDVTDSRTAFIDRKDAEMEARFGRLWTRF